MAPIRTHDASHKLFFCCRSWRDSNAFLAHKNNVLSCPKSTAPICSLCKNQVGMNKRKEHEVDCMLRKVCNGKSLDEARGRVRVINIHHGYLLQKLLMDGPADESRAGPQGGIEEGDWLFFSATSGSVEDAIKKLPRDDVEGRARLAKDRGRIMGYGRAIGFARDGSGKWPFGILFKRIYPINANVKYQGINSILPNFLSVTPHPELMEEMAEIMRAYARAELEAEPITWAKPE